MDPCRATQRNQVPARSVSVPAGRCRPYRGVFLLVSTYEGPKRRGRMLSVLEILAVGHRCARPPFAIGSLQATFPSYAAFAVGKLVAQQIDRELRYVQLGQAGVDGVQIADGAHVHAEQRYHDHAHDDGDKRAGHLGSQRAQSRPQKQHRQAHRAHHERLPSRGELSHAFSPYALILRGAPLPSSSPCHVHEFCGLLSAVCRVSPAICWLRGVLVTKWQRWEASGCP